MVTVGLGGCAAMSQDECRVADWRTVGYEDGTRGKEKISAYRRACAKAGVAPDLDGYRLGYGEGLKVYCRPLRGYQEGRKGRPYTGACPRDLEPAFVNAYEVGRRVHGAEREAARLRMIIASSNRGIARAESRINKIERQLDEKKGLTAVQRKAKRAKIRELRSKDIPQLKAERFHATNVLRAAMDKVKLLRDNLYER